MNLDILIGVFACIFHLNNESASHFTLLSFSLDTYFYHYCIYMCSGKKKRSFLGQTAEEEQWQNMVKRFHYEK